MSQVMDSIDRNQKQVEVNQTTQRRWMAPQTGGWKVNVDVAFSTKKNEGSLAYVCRDDKDEMIKAWGKNIKCKSALVAKAEALREAVRFIASFEKQEVEVESDALVVVQSCTDQMHSVPWEIRPIISEICRFKEGGLNCKIRYISRKANQVADYMANRALQGDFFGPIRLL